ncbi:MAG: orotate phosphoribosyltransferase [Victivallales bacterium]|nr:orotate phosphoribosyltransferase [Victivallales bacterium]MCF7888615.1 orotate phosphoribosyltransferase [Victivallales bacterium]
MYNFSRELAEAAIHIKAIKINTVEPFVWSSGYSMPIYSDNRRFLFYPQYRGLIAQGFRALIETEEFDFDIIAGTSTAGIPYGAILADYMETPFIYIRNKPKDHGLKNLIEGLDAEANLDGKKVIVIEDTISTGGSSARTVQAVRNAKGHVDYCLSIFSYGFDKAEKTFNSLEYPCNIKTLLTYDTLIKTAKKIGYISSEQAESLAEWREAPFEWGEKRGFRKV